MQITPEDVEKIAALAKLKFADNEKEEIRKQMDQILEYVQKLNELDTDNIEPTYYVQEAAEALREDVVKPSLDREVALKNAPSPSNGFFGVPKVIG